MDEIYEKIENPEERLAVPEGESEIQKFYAGQTVFLTGSTGFMGKCIVEKLLRSCPDLKKLYLLVRPKREWTVEQRMERSFQNVIFDTLKKTVPNFREKVVAVEGNLTDERLGLSLEEWKTLTKETSIILHNAATVKFDERISVALKINVLGTKQMLELSKGCKNLKVFMYVSTTYSNCYMKETEEKFYPPPADMKLVYDMIAADENLRGMSEDGLKTVLCGWPNTYTFTKAIAESIIRKNTKGARFPVGIFRPSIVISTYKEPIKGWCGNLNGPAMTVVAGGMGLLHALWSSTDSIMDFVPVDMCANGLLAASWDVANNRRDLEEPAIYHYGTSTIKPIGSRGLRSITALQLVTKPTKHVGWYYFFIITEHYWLWFILDKLTHFLPAAIVDMALMVQGKKTVALPAYFKINKYLDLIWHFCNGRWQFHTTEIRKVWDRMNPVDSELFFCDLRKFDWEEQELTYWTGIRVYTLKDSMDSLNDARRKFHKLKILHYVVVTSLAVLSLYVTRRFAHYVVDNIF